MKKTSLMDRFIVILLSVIFLLSAADKIYHYRGFVDALRNYILVPFEAAPVLAGPVIALELAIGLGLLIGTWRSTAAMLAAVTLGLFTSAIALNYFFGGRGICGCWFTVTLAEGTASHLLLNGMLLGLALMLWHESKNVIPQPAPA